MAIILSISATHFNILMTLILYMSTLVLACGATNPQCGQRLQPWLYAQAAAEISCSLRRCTWGSSWYCLQDSPACHVERHDMRSSWPHAAHWAKQQCKPPKSINSPSHWMHLVSRNVLHSVDYRSIIYMVYVSEHFIVIQFYHLGRIPWTTEYRSPSSPRSRQTSTCWTCCCLESGLCW